MMARYLREFGLFHCPTTDPVLRRVHELISEGHGSNHAWRVALDERYGIRELDSSVCQQVSIRAPKAGAPSGIGGNDGL